MPKKQTTGLVIGKFMPMHQGHELLIDFAAHHVDRLFVVVDNVPKDKYKNQYIPAEVRMRWVKDACPKAEVFYIPRVNPQEPHEHPDFWNIWKNSLLNLLPSRPDYVFASEDYGFKLAEALGSIFTVFDVDRYTVHISASEIRSDLSGHWEFLSRAAKPDFLLKICVGGPESTGKSTLAKQLADHFGTVFVPEYARFYVESHNRRMKSKNEEYNLKAEDMLHIARGQIALEHSLLHGAKRLLISDTDVWATTLWSKWLFNGKCDNEIIKLAQQTQYDLYLLTKPDISWKEDDVRYFPKKDDRIRFFKEYEQILKDNKCNYIVIDGSGHQRIENAIKAVEKFLDDRFKYQYLIGRLQK